MATRLVRQRSDGRWTWHLAADNGDIIATDGSQGYETEEAARDLADRVISGEFRDARKKARTNEGMRSEDRPVSQRRWL